jgi:outer membrane receptor for ferrienterochelin and colicins
MKYGVYIGLLIQVLLFNYSNAQPTCTIQVLSSHDSTAITQALYISNCGKKQVVSNTQGQLVLDSIACTCNGSITALGYEQIFNIKPVASIVYLNKRNVNLNEVIVTGQAKKILAENSIYKVFTINNATIKKQALNNLSDVLGQEAGFYRQQDNILGSATNLMGVGGQNIKVLINGIPINGRENGNIDLAQINITNAQRIEIVKGPMSVLYGTDALGGVINIITKEATQPFTASLQTYAESINKINTNAELGFAKGKHAVHCNIARNFFGGYLFTDSFSRAQQWKPKVQYNTDVQYNFTYNKVKLSYTPSYMWEKIYNKGTPTVDPFSATAIDEYYTTQRFSQVLSAEVDADANSKFTFNNGVNIYYRTRTKYSKDMASLQELPVVSSTGADTSRFIDYNFRGIGNSKFNNSVTIQYGYDINIQEASSLKLQNKIPSIHDYALFISTPIELFKNLQLQPAVRLSYNNLYYVPAIPSLNIRTKLYNRVLLRASYAKGFRAPSFKEMYLYFVDVNHYIVGNPALKPEESTHTQLFIESTLKQTKRFKYNIVSATYYNDIANQIALALLPNTANQFVYVNIGTFNNIAQELSLQILSKKSNITIGTMYNAILAQSTINQYRGWEALAKGTYYMGRYNTGINWMYRYIHNQPILAIATVGGSNFSNSYLPPQHLADVNVSQQFFKGKLGVQLGIRNLFNITSLTIQGNTGGGIHSHGNTQSVYPARSLFTNIIYRW